jgi:addiction module RelB/DinJ family antitoxin
MYTAVINVKTHPEIKNQAKKIAEELGFSLSSLVNAYLKQLIKTKTVVFSTSSEIPSDYMIKMLRQAKREIKERKVSQSFTDSNEALSYLDNLINNDHPNKD